MPPHSPILPYCQVRGSFPRQQVHTLAVFLAFAPRVWVWVHIRVCVRNHARRHGTGQRRRVNRANKRLLQFIDLIRSQTQNNAVRLCAGSRTCIFALSLRPALTQNATTKTEKEKDTEGQNSGRPVANGGQRGIDGS